MREAIKVSRKGAKPAKKNNENMVIIFTPCNSAERRAHGVKEKASAERALFQGLLEVCDHSAQVIKIVEQVLKGFFFDEVTSL